MKPRKGQRGQQDHPHKARCPTNRDFLCGTITRLELELHTEIDEFDVVVCTGLVDESAGEEMAVAEQLGQVPSKYVLDEKVNFCSNVSI